MARPLRIQNPGAIYHAMARGNGRQLLFHGEDDYQRMTDGLEKTVGRTGWEVFAFVWMPNHIHLFFRTPRPNRHPGDRAAQQLAASKKQQKAVGKIIESL